MQVDKARLDEMLDATDRDMIARGDRIGARLARDLLEVFDAYRSLRSTEGKEGEIEQLTRERDEALSLVNYAEDVSKTVSARAEAAEAHVANLLEALKPSGDTKAAYMGEFSFPHQQWNVEGDDTETVQIQVPWTTIKEIMAAISSRAALTRSPQ